MKKKYNRLNVRPGDIVLADLSLIREKPFNAYVMNVEERLTADHLIEIEHLEPVFKEKWDSDELEVAYPKGTTRHIDISFVKEILSRGEVPKFVYKGKKNIFRKIADSREAFGSKKGQLVGPFNSLLIYGLSKVSHLELTSCVLAAAHLLYEKHRCPGLVKTEYYGLLTVNKKAFLKWVKKNAQNLVTPKKIMLQIEKDFEEEMTRDYFQSLDTEEERMNRMHPLHDEL